MITGLGVVDHGFGRDGSCRLDLLLQVSRYRPDPYCEVRADFGRREGFNKSADGLSYLRDIKTSFSYVSLMTLTN